MVLLMLTDSTINFYKEGNPVKFIDPDGRGWIKNDEDGTVSWNAEAESQETTPKGSSYIGATVEGVDENGNFIYGAQDGKTYDSAPLPEVVVTAKMPEHIRDMQAAAELGIYEGQQAFLEHPITQATVGILTCFITPEIWAARTFASSAALTSANLLKPLGLGSTGRAIAANLTEQLAMKEIMSNPTLGKTVMTGMKDSRWLGWNKMQYTHTALNGTKTTIHYVGKFENGVLKAVDDFKFK